MTSLNKLNAAKIIRRPDTGPVIRLSALRVVKGFNEREAGPELEAHIEALKRHKLAGGKWPPIVVKLEEAGASLVDGHCRTEATRRALAEDTSIADESGEVWLQFTVFDGNDADAVAAIAQTNAGLKLSPLELARVYKRLAGFDWSVARIAQAMQKSDEHVRQALTLANANVDVQRMVAAGTVTAAEAVKVVRKRGAQAGPELASRLAAAHVKGDTKVRPVSDAHLFKALEAKVTIAGFNASTGILQLKVAGMGSEAIHNLRELARHLLASSVEVGAPAA